MTVTSVVKDFDRLTLTLVADFDAPVERVWQLWGRVREPGRDAERRPADHHGADAAHRA